jgi:hypothetical protein
MEFITKTKNRTLAMSLEETPRELWIHLIERERSAVPGYARWTESRVSLRLSELEEISGGLSTIIHKERTK